MAIRRYLAMTAAQLQSGKAIPGCDPAWMACHFSPYSSALTNLPTQLPQGALLILDDWEPLDGHDSRRIADQLSQVAEAYGCCNVLLDFQRRDTPGLRELAEHLIQALPCPVVVPAALAQGLNCPVFLPPCPHHIPLGTFIAPWQGRELWLDVALDGQTVTVTEEGSTFAPGENPEDATHIHRDKSLCCHYCQEITPAAVRFHLWRTREDLDTLAVQAEEAGVSALVGLYQEIFGQTQKPSC